MNVEFAAFSLGFLENGIVGAADVGFDRIKEGIEGSGSVVFGVLLLPDQHGGFVAFDVVRRLVRVIYLERKLRFHRSAVFRVGFVFGGPEDGHFIAFGSIDGAVLATASNLLRLAEESGEVIEVFLGPVVEGVIVALRAADPDTHENLGSGGGEFHGCGIVAENISHGGIGIGAAGRADEFADDFIVRFFLFDRSVDVGEELISAGDIRANAEHVGHEDGPAVGKARMV